MPSRTEALQAAARASAGTAGQFGEDVLAALRLQYPGNSRSGLSEMLANVPGGLQALLNNPSFAAANPLRFASAYNTRALLALTAPSTQLKVWFRQKIVIGSGGFSDLRFLFPGTWMQIAAGDTNFGNNYLIEKCSLEKQTGGAAFTPVYFGGSRSYTVIDGSVNPSSDPVLPSSFGVGSFNQGDVYWLRGLISVANNTCKYPIDGENNGQIDVESKSFRYDPNYYIPADVDGTGAFTFSTPGIGDSGFSFATTLGVIVVGSALSPNAKYIAGFGDSILFGFADSTGTGRPHGFFQKALWGDSSYSTSPLAGLKIGISSSDASTWSGFANASTKDLMKYGNVTVAEWGINNPLYTEEANLWAYAKSLGHKVIQTKLLSRTTSTDSWATVANQTVLDASYITPTGSRPVYSAACLAQVGTLIDSFVSFDAVVMDGTNRDKFQANMTADGTHPNTTADDLMAAVMRTAIAALP